MTEWNQFWCTLSLLLAMQGAVLASDDGVDAATIEAFKPAPKNSSGITNSGYWNGQYDEGRDSLARIALAQAKVRFARYHTVCGNKVLVKSSNDNFYQFSGASPEIRIIGINPLYESDLLNGKLWSGSISVSIGKSVRRISYWPDGDRKVSEWSGARSVEMNLVFNGHWQLESEPSSYAGSFFKLVQNVDCASAGLP